MFGKGGVYMIYNSAKEYEKEKDYSPCKLCMMIKVEARLDFLPYLGNVIVYTKELRYET